MSEHARKVLETQTILHLHSCSIEELFEFYQNADRVFIDANPDDTVLTCYIYALGQLRFGRKAWGDHQIEFFKKRARENANYDAYTQVKRRAPAPSPILLSDLDL